jgi:hypothetical protein
VTDLTTFTTPDASDEDLWDLLLEIPHCDKRGAGIIGRRFSRHFSITAFLALILSSCGLLARRDGLFECDYSRYGNPPVVYRYYRNSKILAMINQGEHVINRKFSVEEVGEKVLWRQDAYASNSLNLETMELKEHIESSFGGPQTTSIMCKWK